MTFAESDIVQVLVDELAILNSLFWDSGPGVHFVNIYNVKVTIFRTPDGSGKFRAPESVIIPILYSLRYMFSRKYTWKVYQMDILNGFFRYASSS